MAELVLEKAISARVKFALVCYRRGDLDGAMNLLEQLERVLPFPDLVNWRAAKDCARRPRVGRGSK